MHQFDCHCLYPGDTGSPGNTYPPTGAVFDYPSAPIIYIHIQPYIGLTHAYQYAIPYPVAPRSVGEC